MVFALMSMGTSVALLAGVIYFPRYSGSKDPWDQIPNLGTSKPTHALLAM